MSDQEIEQQQVVQDFINSYNTYKTSDDVAEITLNIVIPNFSTLACELEQIIESINAKNFLQTESMDFIEMVFNPNLYQVILESIDKTKDNFTHYLIVLVEFTKLERYHQMAGRLNGIISGENTILFDGLKQASKERIDNCQERIRQIYLNLEKLYPNFVSSKSVIQMLFQENNFSL